MKRPKPHEYASYYETYVALVPDGDVIEILARQVESTRALLEDLDDERARYRYAPGKWSLKEVVGHVADTERVFAYRALALARGDGRALPGFDENAYAASAGHDERDLADLAAELVAVRGATVALLGGLPADAEARTGTINGYTFVLRTIPYVVAGHELHHRRVIQERYL